MPATSAVRPVRPPASTPEVDSTKVVMVVLPVSAPRQVPMASTRKGRSIPGRLPFSSSMLARLATASTVPSVEKKSPKKHTNTRISPLAVNTPLKSRLNMTLPSSPKSGTAATPLSVVTPRGMPMSVVAMMLMRMAPLTFRALSTMMSSRPPMASSTAGSVRLPRAMPFSNEPMPQFLKPR